MTPSLFFPSISLYLLYINHIPMNNPSETPRREYQSPVLRIIPIRIENALCESPVPGGNEDIGYEDWD